MHAGRIDILAPQSCGGGFGGGEMQRRKAADDPAVHFLGPGMVDIAAAQPRLDMRDRDLAIVCRQRGAHRGGGIALHDDDIRLFRIEDLPDPGQQAGGERIERLVGLHQVEIVIGRHPGDVEHLVEHPAMLARHAHARDETLIRLQRMDQREQLDRLGPCAEDGEDFTRGSAGRIHARAHSAIWLSALQPCRFSPRENP